MKIKWLGRPAYLGESIVLLFEGSVGSMIAMLRDLGRYTKECFGFVMSLALNTSLFIVATLMNILLDAYCWVTRKKTTK